MSLLSKVEVTTDVLYTCLNHALTTECEEIMGLLLGNTRIENNHIITKVWSALPQIRVDRRKDRVEPSPEQLSQAISIAEQKTKESNVYTTVVGWYHSHPKITVFPSDVDLKTQYMHQCMDRETGFIGLIISCFNNDNTLKCTAFQSEKINNEKTESFANANDDLTGNDDEMAKAIRMSLQDTKMNEKTVHQEWRHVKVPMEVIPQVNATDYSKDLIYLQNMLLHEERKAYVEAITKDNHYSSVMQFHHGATYLQNLSVLANGSIIPLYNALVMKQKENAFNIKQLDKQIELYKKAIKKKKDLMKRSTRSIDMRHENLELLLDEKFDNDSKNTLITIDNKKNVTINDKDNFKSPTIMADNLYDLSSIEDDNSVKSNLEQRLKDPVQVNNESIITTERASEKKQPSHKKVKAFGQVLGGVHVNDSYNFESNAFPQVMRPNNNMIRHASSPPTVYQNVYDKSMMMSYQNDNDLHCRRGGSGGTSSSSTVPLSNSDFPRIEQHHVPMSPQWMSMSNPQQQQPYHLPFQQQQQQQNIDGYKTIMPDEYFSDLLQTKNQNRYKK